MRTTVTVEIASPDAPDAVRLDDIVHRIAASVADLGWVAIADVTVECAERLADSDIADHDPGNDSIPRP